MPSQEGKPEVTRAISSTFDADMRERLMPGHPMRGGDYTLPTPMMQRTYALVRELVWARRTGTVFYSSRAWARHDVRSRSGTCCERSFPMFM